MIWGEIREGKGREGFGANGKWTRWNEGYGKIRKRKGKAKKGIKENEKRTGKGRR